MTTEQSTTPGDWPLAFTSDHVVGEGDRVVLVLRSAVWDVAAVADITSVLDRMGLEGRYAILYLDSTDELHVVRAK